MLNDAEKSTTALRKGALAQLLALVHNYMHRGRKRVIRFCECGHSFGNWMTRVASITKTPQTPCSQFTLVNN